MTTVVRGFALLGIAASLGFQACQQRSPQVPSTSPTVSQAPASASSVPRSPDKAPSIPQAQAALPAKTSRTPVQQKLDSHLIAAAQMARESPRGAADPSLQRANPALELDGRGNVHVDVQGAVNDELLAQITTLCGTVESAFPNYGTLRAWIPILSLETLASRPDVTFIKPAERAIFNSRALTGSTTEGHDSLPNQPAAEQNVRTQSNPSGNTSPQAGCQEQR